MTLSALNAPPEGDVDIDGSSDQHTMKKLEFDSGVVSLTINIGFLNNYLRGPTAQKYLLQGMSNLDDLATVIIQFSKCYLCDLKAILQCSTHLHDLICAIKILVIPNVLCV